VSIAKKHAAATEEYRTNATRYDREKRITDMMNDDDK